MTSNFANRLAASKQALSTSKQFLLENKSNILALAPSLKSKYTLYENHADSINHVNNLLNSAQDSLNTIPKTTTNTIIQTTTTTIPNNYPN